MNREYRFAALIHFRSENLRSYLLVENSRLICTANHSTGFYMTGTGHEMGYTIQEATLGRVREYILLNQQSFMEVSLLKLQTVDVSSKDNRFSLLALFLCLFEKCPEICLTHFFPQYCDSVPPENIRKVRFSNVFRRYGNVTLQMGQPKPSKAVFSLVQRP